MLVIDVVMDEVRSLALLGEAKSEQCVLELNSALCSHSGHRLALQAPVMRAVEDDDPVPGAAEWDAAGAESTL
ncbi:hypothetical protein ES703_101707 [subsurface metagenome]